MERVRLAVTKVGTQWLLAMAVAAATTTTASGTTAEVARAVGDYLTNHATMDVFASPDGSFWTLGYESRGGPDTVRPTHPFPLSRRGPALHLRHLDGRGSQVGSDVVLTDVPNLDEVHWAYLVGFQSDGGPFLQCASELLDPTWDRLALVDSGRLVAVSSQKLRSGEVSRWNSVVSPSGRLRVFSDGPPRSASYIAAQRDGDFDFVNPCSLRIGEVPGYLYWSWPRTALTPSGQDAFIAAVYREGRGFSVYRFDFESLALRDSGFLPEEDVWQVVNVPVLNRPVLVASDSGFWLYSPARNPQNPDLDVDEQAKQMRVYRIGSNLQAPPTIHKVAVSVRPYSLVGPGATRLVRLNYLPTSPGKGQKVRFDFWAYGADGQLYHSVETASLHSKPR